MVPSLVAMTSAPMGIASTTTTTAAATVTTVPIMNLFDLLADLLYLGLYGHERISIWCSRLILEELLL